MEVVAPGVSKGQALDVVARHLRVSQAEVVAFGDARNDIEMLAFAGYGVAMGGAPAELLAVANAQTETVQKDGLAREIRRILGRYAPAG
jgi:hydroxymethylpyrimidine pyrophosphatase-like HAD family hydrolase